MSSAGESSPERFRDPLDRLCCFAGEIFIRCPRCAGRASILPDPLSTDSSQHRWSRRRLSCLGCAYTDDWDAPRSAASPSARMLPEFSGPNDPYFGIPLWLSVDCRGRVLWAYNAEHLDLLEAYVSARLRERGQFLGSMSLVERLPAWIKDGKHRADVLHGIGRLRASLV
jgi:hypothetical protein